MSRLFRTFFWTVVVCLGCVAVGVVTIAVGGGFFCLIPFAIACLFFFVYGVPACKGYRDERVNISPRSLFFRRCEQLVDAYERTEEKGFLSCKRDLIKGVKENYDCAKIDVHYLEKHCHLALLEESSRLKLSGQKGESLSRVRAGCVAWLTEREYFSGDDGQTDGA